MFHSSVKYRPNEGNKVSDTALCSHSVTSTQAAAIFGQDSTGIFNQYILTAKTKSGSTYQIILTGPTISAKNGHDFVRKVDFDHTDKHGRRSLNFDEYIGIIQHGASYILFTSDQEEDDDDIEHTRMRKPKSSWLLPEGMRLEIPKIVA